LKMSSDFRLLRGSTNKEFTSYHLPDRSLIYLLHALLEQEGGSPQRVLESEEWRMYLMRSSDLRAELLRLHQFHELEYHFAGSLVQLSLPCADLLEYAQEMAA
jgi:hypothetical protein